MDPVTLALLLAVVACFVGVLFTRSSRHPGKRLPPGPRGVPLFGNALSIPKRDYIYFNELKKTYGDLVLLRMGSVPMVHLNSARAMREALVTQADNFSGRLKSKYFDQLMEYSGIIFRDGPESQEHRRFTLRVLRDFGIGRSLSEEKTLIEFDHFFDSLTTDQPVETLPMFTRVTNNVISQLAFGERTASEDPEFDVFQEHLKAFDQERSITAFIPIFFPIVLKIPLFMRIFEHFVGIEKVLNFAHDYMRRKIEKHAAILREAGNIDQQEPKDLCDALLIERARKEKENPGEAHSFTDMQLVRDLLELFIAGTDTTAITMTWAMFLMAINKDVQAKVQAEIDSVIGSGRKVAMKDRREMPFVSATVDEVLRFSTIAPSGIPHRCRQDTELLGYFIPKDATVFTNIYSIHRDPDAWEKPNEFSPYHFLTSDGNYKPSEHLVPFSMGRRACLGEGLAKMEIFLFFVSIFQHFNIQLAEREIDVDAVMLGKGGGQRVLLPHEVIFTRR